MTQWDFSANTRTEKHKPKQSPIEGQANTISQQDRQIQSNKYDTASKDVAAGQGTFANFEGKTQDSPYYKSLLATSTDATTKAYDNAKASSAQRAKAAGFGYDSPIGGAVSRETEGAEAGALARLPAQAMQETAPLQLEAARGSVAGAGVEAGMGTAAGQQGEGYFTQGVVPLEQEYQQRKARFAANLAKVSPLFGAINGDPSGFANLGGGGGSN